MCTSKLAPSLRRSSRVAVAMPVTISNLEPTTQFFELCETLVINAHGCSLRSPIKLQAGLPLQFQLDIGRQTTARVVDCQPIGSSQPGWKVAAQLDLPGNFWGLSSCPDDWMRLTETVYQPSPSDFRMSLAVTETESMRALIAEYVLPLQAELANVKERLQQHKQRNRFEVSLSHIPPEVEERLWMRVREDLATQALRQSQDQADKLLARAQSAIELKITETESTVQESIREQVQGLDQRVQALSEQMAAGLRRSFSAADEEFQKRASAAGVDLSHHAEALLERLLGHLREEHELHRRELHVAQADATAETSRIQTQLAEIGRRVAECKETAENLESGLNTRLIHMSAEIVSGARAQLESATDSLFEDLVARNTRAIGQQLEDATIRLKALRTETEAFISEFVQSNAAKQLQSLEEILEESAKRAVARWCLVLAQDLSSIAGLLGEHFGPGTKTKA